MATLITKTESGITIKKVIQLMGFETRIDKKLTILFDSTKQPEICFILDCEEAKELQDYIKHPVTNIDDDD